MLDLIANVWSPHNWLKLVLRVIMSTAISSREFQACLARNG